MVQILGGIQISILEIYSFTLLGLRLYERGVCHRMSAKVVKRLIMLFPQLWFHVSFTVLITVIPDQETTSTLQKHINDMWAQYSTHTC